MPISPKSPSSLLRSLGADDQPLKAKTKSMAKEAEQRWPLFKALGPEKALATPSLSDEEKAVWSQRPTAPASIHRPALTRTSTSNKLAAGLEKLVKPATKAGVKAPPAPAPYGLSDAPAATRARTAERNPLSPQPSTAELQPLVPSAPAPTPAADAPGKSPRSLFGSGRAGDALAPAPAAASGLFKFAAPQAAAESAKPPSKSLFSAPPASSASVDTGTESLASVFQRIEAPATTGEANPRKRGSSVLRRIGKR